MNNICAIVVTYNRKNLLKECICALLNQKIKLDVMIIDNASTDGTKEEINKWIEKHEILYKNTGANLGGAGGFHFGMKEGVKAGYEYLWVMDDDTIPTEEALINLLKAANKLNNDFGFLSSTAFFNENELCKMNRPGISEGWYTMKKYHYLKEGLINLRYASFVSLFLKTDTIKKVGLPIKEFFIWNDDYEYTTRITKKYDSYLVCDSIVSHKMKENRTTNILTDNTERIGRYFYNFRNSYYVAKRDGIKEIVRYNLCMMELGFKLLFGKNEYKFRKLGILCRGVWKGIFFNPKVEYID